MHKFRALILGVLGAFLGACAPAPPEPGARVAVAANFRETADMLASAFEAERGERIELVFGSTGQLYAQIVNGAPFDAFLSADHVRPELLQAEGLAVEGSRFTYALGQLALWSADETLIGDDGEEVLRRGDFRKLAIANPELAPYGAAAMEVIGAFDPSGALSPKIVKGESVTQAFMMIHSGNAELGFVALSQVQATGGEGAYWLVPSDLYTPIRQDAALLTRGADKPAAKAFLEFLQTDEGRQIISSRGYGVED